MARLVHIDDVAAEIERVGAFVDDVDIGTVGKCIAHGAEGAREVHRLRISLKLFRHPCNVLLLALTDLLHPRRARFELSELKRRVEGRHHGLNVTDDRGRYCTVAIDLGRRDVDLHKLRVLGPKRSSAVREQPIKTRAHQHHHVGLADCERACGRRRLRMIVGQQPLRHRHWQEWHARRLDEGTNLFIRLRVGGALSKQDQRTFCRPQQAERVGD